MADPQRTLFASSLQKPTGCITQSHPLPLFDTPKFRAKKVGWAEAFVQGEARGQDRSLQNPLQALEACGVGLARQN